MYSVHKQKVGGFVLVIYPSKPLGMYVVVLLTRYHLHHIANNDAWYNLEYLVGNPTLKGVVLSRGDVQDKDQWQGRQRTSDIARFFTSPFPLSLPSFSSLSFNPARGLGSAVSSPSGLATRRI